MKKFLLISFLILYFFNTSKATHNRAGEITFVHYFGLEYIVTIVTYTKTSAPADREYMPIDWGHNSGPDSIQRVLTEFFPELDSQKNTYTKKHTFPTNGDYTLCTVDLNRNGGSINIEDSENVPFSISTILIIQPYFGDNNYINNSVQLLYSPLDQACLGKKFIHNPGAVDIDGDSLSYEIAASEKACGVAAFPYAFPDTYPEPNTPINIMTVDAITGNLIWDSPQQLGEYNVGIRIFEWRKYPNGVYGKIGVVLRDMQINVIACAGNDPPVIAFIQDTCVLAGTTLNINVTATDPNLNNMELTSVGEPYLLDNPASFDQTISTNPAAGNFQWQTNCSHVRQNNYQVSFKAIDFPTGGDIPLVDFKSFFITIVAPEVENLLAEPIGQNIQLSWNASECSNATGYKIYRRSGLYNFDPDNCETGVPAYTGYVQIGILQGLNNTNFLDSNNVLFGVDNCYMVVACFADGAESYASEEICAQIKKVLPVITKVSVGITDLSFGIDTLKWIPPSELDTLVTFPAPYFYKVYQSVGTSSATEFIYQTPPSSSLYLTENSLVVTDLDTKTNVYSYKIELYSNGSLVTKSNIASSVFLSIEPNDNRMDLSWNFNVPWSNFKYDIYKLNDNTSQFDFLTSTTSKIYSDSNLINGQTYCYYVVANGTYLSDLVLDTLINFSQQVCSSPYDKTPPCAPVLTIDGSCELEKNFLSWTNPNQTCPETDDVMFYNIYFAPIEGQPLQLIVENIAGAELTTFEHSLENSIAGCYAITALDSLRPDPSGVIGNNESLFSNIVCVDNCPLYFLPNVFSPNNDGQNDLFVPFPYRFIKDVDLKIFNRWGHIVFETTSADINWDGKNKDSGEFSSDGVYYYTCLVNQITLRGIEPVELKGYFHIFSKTKPFSN